MPNNWTTQITFPLYFFSFASRELTFAADTSFEELDEWFSVGMHVFYVAA